MSDKVNVATDGPPALPQDGPRDGEGFLARWSRLKRGDEPIRPETSEAPADPAPVRPGPALAAADEPSLIDLTKLPRLEDLTIDSNFAAFLQKGVPEELKRLALRKAWAIDPAIRDFIEVAENQYDWNAIGGVPGFGEIPAGTDMQALLAQAIGELPKIDAEIGARDEAMATDFAREPEPQAPEPAAMAAVRQSSPMPVQPVDAPGPLSAEVARPANRPRHGGALPQVPKSQN